MKLGIMENGLRKAANPKRKRSRRRRRNPVAAKASSAPRSRSVSLATARNVIKRNGLKVVSKVANGRKRRKRRRRNGLATVSRRSNGFFGNSKNDAKQVLSLGAGALGTKALSGAVAGFVSPILSQIGVGQYSKIITDTGIALFVAPFVGNKIGGSEVGKFARLGSLLVVGLDVVEMFAPGFLSFNPFNTAPIVMTPGGAAIAPAAAAQLAQEVADSPNPQATAAAVGRAMLQVDAAGAQGFADPTYVDFNDALVGY